MDAHSCTTELIPGMQRYIPVQNLIVLQLMFLKYWRGNTHVVAHFDHSLIELYYYFINPSVYI